jgi:hypothetical protein
VFELGVQHEEPETGNAHRGRDSRANKLEDLARCSAQECAWLGHHLYCGGDGTHVGGDGRI